ncbi:uncharacterized protein [Procambarus clarkii]|uniref:uncharacterized protein n=1 Tax=Procambarus clarkii TaxID=6728 RepID=UPI0037429525
MLMTFLLYGLMTLVFSSLSSPLLTIWRLPSISKLNGNLIPPFLFLTFTFTALESRFSFSVYRKPMHSGMYIHFFSYHPPAVKESVLVSLFLYALRISDPQFLDSETAFIYKSFSRLGYPLHFINCAYSQFKRNFIYPKPASYTSSTVFCLPFISEHKTFANTFYPLAIKLAFRHTNTHRRNIFHTAPPASNAAGVYSISCSSCPLQYFGETGRTLNDRRKEHKRSEKSADTSNSLF